MKPRAGVVAVILLGLVLVAGPALALATGDSAASGPSIVVDANVTDGTDGNSSGAPMGSQLSAFMQSNAVAANESVETGMWVHGVNENASVAARQVDRRTERLEKRLERLEANLDRLRQRGVNASNPAQAGEVARLTARLRSLQRSVNETEHVAARVGVNTTRLDRLRANASTLSGHEVAAMARNLSLGPPVDVPRGPPGDVPGGPPEDKGGPPETVTDERPGNQSSGTPENGSAGSSDGSEDPAEDERTDRSDDTRGPPDDRPEGPPGNETDRPGQ